MTFAMTFLRTICLFSMLAPMLVTPGWAQTVGREQDVVGLRLGQRVLVDDGTCPAGQIKEVRGAKMTQNGIAATRSCVPRFGPKTK